MAKYEPTAEQLAYARKLLEIQRRFGRLERDTLKRSIALLRDFRNRVAGQMSELSDFQQWRIRELQANLDELITQYEGQLRGLGANAVRGSINLGRAAVVEPLESAGITSLFFRPSPAQINVLLDFTADLIGGIGHDMRKRINTQIRIAALGEKSPFQAMRDITKIMGIPPKVTDPAKGIAYEAERILRTETNRAYNLATFSQQRDLAEQVPGLKKQWIATGDERTRDSHLAAHGQVVLVNRPFVVGGANLLYPLDPAGPPEETINCRCTSITVIPEIGAIPSPLDVEIERERARRDKEKKRKPAKALDFKNDKEAAYKWGKPYYQESANKWSSARRMAIENYQQLSYRNMNDILRGTLPSSADKEWYEDKYGAEINEVKGAIKASKPLDTPIIVYRGVEQSVFADLGDNMDGAEFVDKGFISTSLLENIGGHAARYSGFGPDAVGVLLEIELPKGTRAASMMHGGGRMARFEAELVLMPGTRFEITDVTSRMVETAVDEGKSSIIEMLVYSIRVIS